MINKPFKELKGQFTFIGSLFLLRCCLLCRETKDGPICQSEFLSLSRFSSLKIKAPHFHVCNFEKHLFVKDSNRMRCQLSGVLILESGHFNGDSSFFKINLSEFLEQVEAVKKNKKTNS